MSSRETEGIVSNDELSECPKVRPFLAVLRAKKFSPDFAFGEGNIDEYFRVRIQVLMDRWNRTVRDPEECERDDRAVMRQAYADETFDLKWAHRQRQLQDRVLFGERENNARLELDSEEERLRVQVYDAAVADLVEVARLEEHRRGALIKHQTSVLKCAVAKAEIEAAQREKAFQDAWDLEVELRLEARERNAINDEERSAAQRLWTNGRHAVAQLQLELKERRARTRILDNEQWTRHLDIRAAHVLGMVVHGEQYYRSKMEHYEEPRRRDAIEQKFLRERDFAAWRGAIKDVGSRWKGETLSLVPPSKSAQRM
jgi:hypothetical protein